MTSVSVGLWCIFDAPIVDTPARIDEIVQLLTDSRWPWQPQLLHATSIAGGPLTPQVKGKIRGVDLPATIRAALTASSTSRIELNCTKLSDSNHASIVIDSGRYTSGWNKVPFEIRARIHVDAMPTGKSVAAWIELGHALVVAVRAVHAVIPVTRNHLVMNDELYLSTTTVNDRTQHPDAMEIKRIHQHRSEIGTTYVRPPRWGNYLGPQAVAAARGREGIVALVRPAVVRDVGALLYVQLSETIEDAFSAETALKRKALGDLLAPVMIPSA